MFTEIIKEYDQRRAELRFRSTHAKQELAKLEKQTATHILNSLNSNVETLHEHQKMIDTQAKMFRTETAKLATQTKKWVTMYDQLNESLKQVGDLVNWAQIIEDDMKKVSSTIARLVEDSSNK